MREIVPLVSFPRSGNTWLRVLLAKCLSNNPDDINSMSLINYVIPIANNTADLNLSIIDEMLIADAPILIKQHVAYSNIPFKNIKKIIYIYRNKYDCLKSYWTFTQKESLGLYPNVYSFLRAYAAYVGSWEDHLNSFEQARKKNTHDILFVKYEDLDKNTALELRKVFKFLGIVIDDEKIERTVKEVTKAEMGKMKVGNIFFGRNLEEYDSAYKKIFEKENPRSWFRMSLSYALGKYYRWKYRIVRVLNRAGY